MGHGGHHNRSPRHDLAPAISYREFAPAPALPGVVRAYFSFMPYADRTGRRPITREALVAVVQPFNLPMLADARSSLVLDLTATCHVDRGWSTAAASDARVIGPRQRIFGDDCRRSYWPTLRAWMKRREWTGSKPHCSRAGVVVTQAAPWTLSR